MPRMTMLSMAAQVRKNRGKKSLRDAAREIGTSAPTLQRIESGKLPNIQTFAKLCRWLGADPAEFLKKATMDPGETGAPERQPEPKVQLELSQETLEALADAMIIAQMKRADLTREAGLE